jgi:hypothetical protein
MLLMEFDSFNALLIELDNLHHDAPNSNAHIMVWNGFEFF